MITFKRRAMTTSVTYHCSLPSSECLRLLREVGTQPQQWKSVAPDFGGNTKVKDDGRFVLAPSLNGVVGTVTAQNSHSIARARLSPTAAHATQTSIHSQ